jgi:hypothetical protein
VLEDTEQPVRSRTAIRILTILFFIKIFLYLLCFPQSSGNPIASNAPLDGNQMLADTGYSIGRTVEEFGVDEYGGGSPHSIIDGSLRKLAYTV